MSLAPPRITATDALTASGAVLTLAGIPSASGYDHTEILRASTLGFDLVVGTLTNVGDTLTAAGLPLEKRQEFVAIAVDGAGGESRPSRVAACTVTASGAVFAAILDAVAAQLDAALAVPVTVAFSPDLKPAPGNAGGVHLSPRGVAERDASPGTATRRYALAATLRVAERDATLAWRTHVDLAGRVRAALHAQPLAVGHPSVSAVVSVRASTWTPPPPSANGPRSESVLAIDVDLAETT